MSNRLEKAMFVEDEPDIREMARLAPHDVGVALQYATVMQPDVVLLDATLTALREDDAASEIPVIHISAKVQSNELQGHLEQGVIGAIPKPPDPITLARQVHTPWLASRTASAD